VEEAAAAAESLQQQAEMLWDEVGVFKTEGADGVAPDGLPPVATTSAALRLAAA